MANIVYKMGVHYKWTKNIPQQVMDQLYLAHRLREKLVDISLEYEETKKRIWSADPQINDLENQIFTSLQNLNSLVDKLKDYRIAQRTRNPKGSHVDQLNADIKSEKANLKVLREARKTAITALYTNDPDAKQAIHDANTIMNDAFKDTYRDFVQNQGLSHRTHHYVLGNHKTAVKNVKAKRNKGIPASLRHHGFDGTGSLAVYLKGRGGANTRTPDEVSKYDGPHKNTFAMKSYPEDLWDSFDTSQKRHEGRVDARFCVSTPKVDGGVIELPVQLHRSFPDDAVIKSAILTIERQGTRKVASICVNLTVDDPQPVDDRVAESDISTIAVHFGWRKEKNAVRAMTWMSDTPFDAWLDIQHDPRYKTLSDNLTVSDSLTEGTVTVPDSWIAEMNANENMLSQKDLALDTMREHFITWLKTAGDVYHPFRTDPETENPLLITAWDVERWKSPKRFVSLAFAWRDNPPTNPGGRDIADELESWRKTDKRLADNIAGRTRRIIKRRDDLYAQVANLFTNHFDHIFMDEVDHSELATLANKDMEITNEMSKNFGKQRKNVASATLRSKIENAANRKGLVVKKLSIPMVSVEHETCGVINIKTDKSPYIDCDGCGERYHIDENASIKILLASL